MTIPSIFDSILAMTTQTSIVVPNPHFLGAVPTPAAPGDSTIPGMVQGIRSHMMSQYRTSFLFSLFFLCGAASDLSASGISRKDARNARDRNIQRVREFKGARPNEMTEVLVWYLARPIGDDPKVIALCEELIAQASSTDTVSRTLDGVGAIVDFHRKSLSAAKLASISQILKKVLSQENLRNRLQAAGIIARMGPKFRADSRLAYIKILQDAAAANLDDDTRWDLVRAIELLLERKEAAVFPAIRELTERQGLLSYFESHLDDSRAPGRGSDLQALRAKWKEALKTE